MKICAYGQSATGKSEWVRRLKGVECNSIPDKNKIENFPIVYVFNHRIPKEQEAAFDLVLNFTKESIVVENDTRQSLNEQCT